MQIENPHGGAERPESNVRPFRVISNISDEVPNLDRIPPMRPEVTVDGPDSFDPFTNGTLADKIAALHDCVTPLGVEGNKSLDARAELSPGIASATKNILAIRGEPAVEDGILDITTEPIPVTSPDGDEWEFMVTQQVQLVRGQPDHRAHVIFVHNGEPTSDIYMDRNTPYVTRLDGDDDDLQKLDVDGMECYKEALETIEHRLEADPAKNDPEEQRKILAMLSSRSQFVGDGLDFKANRVKITNPDGTTTSESML